MPDHQPLFERHESQVRAYCRRFDALFVRAVGSELFDSTGRRYIDFLAGCGALNYGHNDPDMAEALIAHVRNQGLSMSMDLHSDSKHRFIELFGCGRAGCTRQGAWSDAGDRRAGRCVGQANQ